MSDIIVSVQRASNVYKATPGLWHTISTKQMTSTDERVFRERESVTCIVTKTIPSDDWKTIEEAENHHWFQVRDPDTIRSWIQKQYEQYFNRHIPSENFLITDIHRSIFQIYPRTFRCDSCKTLRYLNSDKELGIETTQNFPPPAKIGITCINKNCNRRPIIQQPHVLLNYDNGVERQLPTKCPNGHDLKLKFSGSSVSILGWRLSCNEPSCKYSKDRDPFTKDKDGKPYFPFFFDEGKRMAITPSIRGPRHPIVVTKVDTMHFPFKPNESLLASIFEYTNAPLLMELFTEWCKIRNKLIEEFRIYGDTQKICIKKAERQKRGEPLYNKVEEILLKNDSGFSSISKRADEAGINLKNYLITLGKPVDQVDSLLQKLRFDFDEIINLFIANGFSYPEFINSLPNTDPRRNTIENFNQNTARLCISSIRYLYHDEPVDPCKEPNRSLQIVKVGIGTFMGEVNTPFHRIKNVFFDECDDKNHIRRKPSDVTPIVYGTNHPIEGLFICINPAILLKKCNIDIKSENPKIDLALLDEGEKIKQVEKLLHTFSHVFIRRVTQISGLGLGSVSHRIFPRSGAFLIYTNVYPTLGQLREVFENRTLDLIEPLTMMRMASSCPRDPICSENEIDPANCFACLHIPDHCCDGYWNRQLDRQTLWNNDGSGLWNQD